MMQYTPYRIVIKIILSEGVILTTRKKCSFLRKTLHYNNLFLTFAYTLTIKIKT